MIFSRVSSRRAFTLVELLVAIGIIGILVAIGIPAFQKLTSGNRLSNTASMIRGMSEQAQSMALTHRRYVALLIDDKGQLYGGRDQAVWVCFVKDYNDSTGVAAFEEPIAGVNWRRFPDGVVLAAADTSSSLSPRNSLGTGLANTGTVNYDSKSFDAIIFSPSGNVIRPAGNYYLLLAEGVLGGSADPIVYPNRDVDGNLANRTLMEINRFTGKARIIE
ncbi:MAG: Tfp pilus assembly protein FimT/FimU [Victivallaceae bacterium]